AATRAVIPDFAPPARPPAQLRFTDEAAFRALLADGGLRDVTIERVTGRFAVPGARWLAERLAFAPGMAALLGALGERRTDVTAAFVERLEATQGKGPVTLAAVAFVGSGRAPARRRGPPPAWAPLSPQSHPSGNTPRSKASAHHASRWQ